MSTEYAYTHKHCALIYTWDCIYTHREAVWCFFSPRFSVKNWKVKQCQNVSFFFHKHMVIAVLLQNRRWEGQKEEICTVASSADSKYRPFAVVDSAWTLSTGCSSNTRAFPECCEYLLDNSLPPKESKLKHNTSIKGFFPGIYKQCS